MWPIKVGFPPPVAFVEVIPMTNDELWRSYEESLRRREQFKAERRRNRMMRPEPLTTMAPGRLAAATLADSP